MSPRPAADGRTGPGPGGADDRPRIAVVTNGNTFADVALGPLITERLEQYQWLVVVTSGLRRQSGNRAREAVDLLRRWGPRYFGYKAATYALPAVASALDHRPRDVAATCEALGVAVRRGRNVNEPPLVDELLGFRPDLLLSFSCPYRIRSQLLELPRVGAINVHSSLLPSYAGVCTYIHVLANGEHTTGVTVHEMVEEFDAGRLLSQAEVPIRPHDTVQRLFREQCRIGGRLLGQVIDEAIATGELTGQVQDAGRRTYFGEPTAADIRALRHHGHRLLGLDDLRALVRPHR